MNKQEFLQRLEAGLVGIVPEDKVAAVQYYTEYFDDAGADNEQSVLAELGDPDKLAADIKAVSELAEVPEAPEAAKLEAEEVTIVQDPFNMAEVPPAPDIPAAPEIPTTNTAPGPASQQEAQSEQVPPQYRFPGGYVPPRYGIQVQGQQPYDGAANPGQNPPMYTQRPASSGAASVAKVLLTIFLVLMFPALVGIGIGLLVILLVPFIMGGAFLVSAAGVFILALYVLGASAGSGLLLLGISLLFLAGGLALCWGGVKIFIKGLPAAFRGVAGMFRAIYGGKGRA